MTEDTADLTALKPCPFCGDRGPEITGERRLFWVACTAGSECLSHGPKHTTEAQAISAWNDRASSPQAQPVAWRIEPDHPGEPFATLSKEQADYYAGRGAKVIAGFTSPPHDQEEALRAALEIIERWELPETGLIWNDVPGAARDETTVSYEAAYGSNGARDYIRKVARDALASAPRASQVGEGNV